MTLAWDFPETALSKFSHDSTLLNLTDIFHSLSVLTSLAGERDSPLEMHSSRIPLTGNTEGRETRDHHRGLVGKSQTVENIMEMI